MLDNITLVSLPSYSPQLNPVENVWAYSRGNLLNRRVWDSYDEMVDARCKAWNAFINYAGHIASITRREWASVSD